MAIAAITLILLSIILFNWETFFFKCSRYHKWFSGKNVIFLLKINYAVYFCLFVCFIYIFNYLVFFFIFCICFVCYFLFVYFCFDVVFISLFCFFPLKQQHILYYSNTCYKVTTSMFPFHILFYWYSDITSIVWTYTN